MKGKKIFFTLISLGIPMMIQSFLQSSLSFFDILMISRLGDNAVASVGVAGQLLFFFSIVQFGIHTGLSVSTAQYHGRGEKEKIGYILGIQLLMGSAVFLPFGAVIFGFPWQFASLYTDDPQIAAGAVSYLKINGVSLLCSVLIYSYTYNLRSTGIVRLPLLASAVSVIVNLILDRLLIFGAGPVPALGIEGAAWASAAARLINAVLLTGLTCRGRSASAVSLPAMFRFSPLFLTTTVKVSLPVFLNELFWVTGISVYNWIYASLGTSSLAAVNINASVENLLYTPFFGLFSAGAFLVGKGIGSGNREEAGETGTVILRFHLILAVLTGGLLILLRDPVISLYSISPEAREYCSALLAVTGAVMAFRVLNYTFNVSIFRGGGDTKYSLFLDFSGSWLIGIPLAIAGGIVLKLPVYQVMALASLEELYKAVLAVRRFKTGRWIRNILVPAGG